QNINVYPEVAGTVKQIFVAEGDSIEVGAPLLLIDESIQRATVEQLQSQAQAALTVLAELRAQPRKETLEVAEAQVSAAEAALKTAQDALQKQQTAFELNAKAVSRDALDAAANTAATARANVDVARKQRDLTKAGAWIYDIRNQERQYAALHKSFVASSALLSKYRLVAPRAGRVLAVHASVGAFVSGQGAYDSYTQGMTPVLVLGTGPAALQVRCYVDEILVPRLPAPGKMKAQMSIRGSDVRIPLTYIRTQPLVSPKIELSDQRLERVAIAATANAACMIGPKYTTPSAPVPPEYKELQASGGTSPWKAAQPGDAADRGPWWAGFNDSLLNDLEERVQVNNQSVAAAAANVQVARALVRQARAQFFPAVTTNPGVTSARIATGFGQTLGVTYTAYAWPVEASWEPDLWGRIRNTVAASRIAAQGSVADLENVRLSAQAELAVEYVQLRAQDAQKQVMDTAVNAYQDALDLTRDRYVAGLESDEAVAQAEAQLTATRAQDTNLGILRAQYEHAIGVLIGEPPSRFSVAVDTRPLTPP